MNQTHMPVKSSKSGMEHFHPHREQEYESRQTQPKCTLITLYPVGIIGVLIIDDQVSS